MIIALTFLPALVIYFFRQNMEPMLGRNPRYPILPADDCGDYSDELSKECTGFPLRDNFESGIGGWTQDDQDQLDWTWNKGSTPSYLTGPNR